MKKTLLSSLGFALALCAAPLAWAGQTVIIDTNVNNNVYGNGDGPNGSATTYPDSLLDPNGNTVIIISGGGTLNRSVYGGYAYANGTGIATSANNSVVISGGTVDGNVYGGYADARGTGNATSANNSVVISGGILDGYVYGGYAEATVTGNAAATYNTVTLSGSPVFDPNTILYGGGVATSNGDQFTGNTLNLWNYSGSSVDAVRNFEFYNFIVPVTQTDPVLEAATNVALGDGDGRASVFTVNTIGGTGPLGVGTDIELIEAGRFVTDGLTYDQARGQHGATLVYDWALRPVVANAPGTLSATLKGVAAAPGAKALSEGFLGGLALTAQGADLIAGQGLAQAMGAGSGGAFAALSGGSVRYNSGSDVDMSSMSLLTGLAWGADIAPGRLTLGSFFEYGTGSYDTRNSFAGAATVEGNGDADYLGGGLLGRLDFAESDSGRFYGEFSARLGRINNEYSSSDLRDATGRGADYDSDSRYYGLHAGLGYIWNISEQAALDFYGKYFWTQQNGDSITLSTGDPVTFEDADSQRLRLGGRLTYQANEYLSPYVGAAWEHEFDGEARASTYGYAIDAPSIKGDTGLGEIGLSVKPAADLPLSFDLGLQGYTGKREGVTGSLSLRFDF